MVPWGLDHAERKQKPFRKGIKHMHTWSHKSDWAGEVAHQGVSGTLGTKSGVNKMAGSRRQMEVLILLLESLSPFWVKAAVLL